MSNMSLTQFAQMENGKIWLTEHFPLPAEYEYMPSWNYENNCPMFQAIHVESFTTVHNPDENEILNYKIKEIPWIDTLFSKEVYAELKTLIRWHSFDYFDIISDEIMKEIINMEIPLSAYHEYLGNFIVNKYHLNHSKVTPNFLVIDERDYFNDKEAPKEIANMLEHEFGYLYVKTVSQKDFTSEKEITLDVFVNENPITFYTVAKLMEN